MRTLIVFDHPYTAAACNNEPHNRSFCAALCKKLMDTLAAKGEEADLIDLHADGFDPVMRKDDLVNWRMGKPIDNQVADYQRRLRAADRVVFFFPIWWESMPAMTKGFIDKVYAKDILYTGSGTNMESTLNKNVQIVLVTVMATPKAVYRIVFGNPIVKVLRRGTFSKTKIRNFKWVNYSDVGSMDAVKRAKLIDSFEL